MEAAIKELINKNAGESAIREFSEFRFEPNVAISKQVISMSRMVDEFYPEEMEIRAYEKDHSGKPKVHRNPLFTKQLRDIFCLFKIFERLPENVNKGYKGQIRKLLQPAMQNISLFRIDEFIKELKIFEEEWTMFEPSSTKPAAPADNAQANMALNKGDKSTPSGADRKSVNKQEQISVHSCEKLETSIF